MARAGDQDQLVLEQLRHLERGRVDGHRGEAHVRRAVEDVGDGLLGAHGRAEGEFYPVVLAHERLEEACEEVDEGLRGRRGADAPARLVVVARDALAQGVGLFEDALGVFERELAGVRELDAALGADEERLAQLALQSLDLVAHRRLRHVKFL